MADCWKVSYNYLIALCYRQDYGVLEMMSPGMKNAYRILASAITPADVARATAEVEAERAAKSQAKGAIEPVIKLKPSQELYTALHAVRREVAQR